MLVKLKKKKLFNKIRINYYPNSWTEESIFSILKSIEKENPNNFRGINLSSSLGKLINAMLYIRLTTKLHLQHRLDFVRTIECQIISSLILTFSANIYI